MPGFLDLPAPVIEQLAKVRLDECIAYYSELSKDECPKRFCFWVLRDLGHRGVYAAAWGARHSVLPDELYSVARLGDAEWCRVILAQHEHSLWSKNFALHRAAAYGQTEVAALFLQHGAEPFSHGLGAHAIEIAERHGHTATAAMLRAHVESPQID